jgi:hypothetical protein
MAEMLGPVAILIGSTDVVAGDVLYHDGTDWELADADDNTKFGELFAAESFSSGESGVGCVGGVLVDADSPFTQGNSMYLSTTAGAITATRPTGAENLAQIVGFCLSTKEVKVWIPPLHEEHINQSPMTDGTAVYSQYGDATGVLLGAASEAAGYTFMVPQNMVEAVITYLWWAGVGTALDTSDTYTIDVSSGVDDETTTTTSDGITAAALTVAASDFNRADVSAAFDGTGILKPGNIVCVDVDKAAEGSAGDDPLVLALVSVIRCV